MYNTRRDTYVVDMGNSRPRVGILSSKGWVTLPLGVAQPPTWGLVQPSRLGWCNPLKGGSPPPVPGLVVGMLPLGIPSGQRKYSVMETKCLRSRPQMAPSPLRTYSVPSEIQCRDGANRAQSHIYMNYAEVQPILA